MCTEGPEASAFIFSFQPEFEIKSGIPEKRIRAQKTKTATLAERPLELGRLPVSPKSRWRGIHLADTHLTMWDPGEHVTHTVMHLGRANLQA